MDGLLERKLTDKVRELATRPPYRITAEQLDYDAEGDVLSAEASTLGFAPGEWPVCLVLDVNGKDQLRFLRGDEMVHRGEFAGFAYNLMDGVTRFERQTIRVFNNL